MLRWTLLAAWARFAYKTHELMCACCVCAETRELYGLQQRVTAAQRLAAAGHKMLCQMAADTLHRSSIRQYVLPLSSMQPGGALAVYHAGRRLAEQQKQQQASPQGSGKPGATQLLLQVASISTALQDRHLQLQVCVRPELHAENKQLAAWSGALLQPCHAELLVWHASHPGGTSNSEWSWDAISGELTITCSLAVDLLLQLHSLNDSTSGAAQPGHSNSEQAAAGIAGGQHLEAGQAQLAHVLAAAAEQVAGTHERSSRSSSSQQMAQGTEAIQLQAAVAVSARCSSQAVVQHEARQPFQQGHALLMRQRAQLLAPALALLHLQPLQVSTQDLLVHQLTGTTPLDAGRPVSAHAAAAAGVKAGDQVTAQTPVRASKQAGAAEHGRRSSMGLPAGASEVVPPTPCSADDGFDGELGVIPDSQEGQEGESEQQQEPHERRQQLQQWWQSQQQRQQASGLSGPEHANGAAAAPAVGAEGMDWEAAQSSDRDDVLPAHAGSLPAAGRSKQLMLQSPHVDLQLVPTALLRMQCFQTVQEGSQRLRLALQPARSPHAPVLQGHAGPVGSGGGVLDFVSLGPHQLHVTVSAPSQHSLGCLEQLLLLAVRQLPGVSDPVGCSLLAAEGVALPVQATASTPHEPVAEA